MDDVFAELFFEQKNMQKIGVVEILPQKTLLLKGGGVGRVLCGVAPACVMCNQWALLLIVVRLVQSRKWLLE